MINPNVIIDNTTLNNYGIEVSDTRYIATDFIKVNPNTSYFTTGLTVGHEYDDNKNFIRVIRNTSSDGIFLTSSNGGYVRLRNYALLENKEAKQEIISKCMLCVGTQETPYQEYYDGYKISGKSCGKNLWSYKKEIELPSESGMSWFDVNGKAGIHGTDVLSKTNTWVHLPKGVYYLGVEKTNCNLQIIDTNGNNIKLDSTWEGGLISLRFKPLDNTQPLYARNIIISSSSTTYEPYQESNYSYILNEPLRSLPNGVCDTIDLATGVLTRRVGKELLNNQGLTWYNSTTAVDGETFRRAYAHLSLSAKGRASTYCDKLIHHHYESFTEKGFSIHPTSGTLHVILPVSELKQNSLEGLKQWLIDNPVTVYYELLEPTTEQLTPQQLKSFDTTTHIISENKLMPIVSTKIPSDVNAVVQGLKAENVKLEKQLDSAIEELNNKDIDLIATDWETDYRLCELEWTILDTMKVETLTENKVLENRILSRYEQAKILIESGKYNKTTMEKQLTMYYNRNYLTKEEFNELMQLMNPIGEVETLEELDKVENI